MNPYQDGPEGIDHGDVHCSGQVKRLATLLGQVLTQFGNFILKHIFHACFAEPKISQISQEKSSKLPPVASMGEENTRDTAAGIFIHVFISFSDSLN